MPTDHRARRPRRRTDRQRGIVVIWLAGGCSAAVLMFGTSGALASWTSAVVGNDTNTVATAKAVILAETDGSTTCRSSDQPTNVSTCSGINKYGGTASPLMPGGSRTVDVTFSNLGAANATTFSLAPGACSQTPTAGSGTPAATNLCTASSELTVAVACSPGATYAGGSAWGDLAYAAGVPPTATKTHTATGAELNAGAQWTCRLTVALNAAASIASQNVVASQPLTWTLAS